MDEDQGFAGDCSQVCLDSQQPEDSAGETLCPSLELLALDGDLEAKLRGDDRGEKLEEEEEGWGVDALGNGATAGSGESGESDMEDVPFEELECGCEMGEVAGLQGLGDSGMGDPGSGSGPDPSTPASFCSRTENSSSDELDQSSGAASLGDDLEMQWTENPLSQDNPPPPPTPGQELQALGQDGDSGKGVTSLSGWVPGAHRGLESLPEVARSDRIQEAGQRLDSPEETERTDPPSASALLGPAHGEIDQDEGNEPNEPNEEPVPVSSDGCQPEGGIIEECPSPLESEENTEAEYVAPPTEALLHELSEAATLLSSEEAENPTQGPDLGEEPEPAGACEGTGIADCVDGADSAGGTGSMGATKSLGTKAGMGVPDSEAAGSLGSSNKELKQQEEGQQQEVATAADGDGSEEDSEVEGVVPAAGTQQAGALRDRESKQEEAEAGEEGEKEETAEGEEGKEGEKAEEGQEEEQAPARMGCEEEQQDQPESDLQTVEKPRGPGGPQLNGSHVDREAARRLAERLYRLEDFRRTDVVKHLDKDNEFSSAVGEEYLKLFDFSGQNLDQALRSFLKVVVLIGETQERERVLQHFAQRFHQCNPHSFQSSGAVLSLTCAVMLLNTDLHGNNLGKAMTVSSFVSNLEGMNEGQSFPKDLLKGLYHGIKSEPLEWAVGEEELKGSLMLPGDCAVDAPLRSKCNPFQDIPHDAKATVYKQGFLIRKAHADIDGKRTPWGKRSWKTFYAVLKGMVLYLQKDEYRMDWQSSEEVVSVHHALAERAADYTKKQHVFRLQTADWRVFLFQASTADQMSSWICRINLVAALYSSPPFPAAVGSQRKFTRPILPATQSRHSTDDQLESHSKMLESFSADLTNHQQNPPEGRRARARDLEEHRLREEYLLHEKSRYEVYVQLLGAWRRLGTTDLDLFDSDVCDAVETDGEELKKSHSSPSLNLDLPTPIVKVKRNISERRTYRKIIVPRRRSRELV
ncbi:PH and SEC7 domain-containing protein 2 isoform X2 [Amia ocellicauda]|uniref:PH and SEC7 domain-containing protein 2 isoform X2 n=1 Tax=Amia ocellicauda TaxID=2972642 RepID=UPI0034638B2A